MSPPVARIRLDQLPAVRSVLADGCHQVCQTTFGWNSDQWAEYNCRTLANVLNCGAAGMLEDDMGPMALVGVEKRAWESEYYPFDMGQIPVLAVSERASDKRECYEALLEWTISKEEIALQHLFCRAPAEDTLLTQTLESAGFRHMVSMMEFSWRRSGVKDAQANRWKARPAEKADWPTVVQLAQDTLTEIATRYTADSHLPLRCTRDLYGAWASRSLQGEFADIVLVISDEDGVAGFICGRFDQDLGAITKAKVGDMTIGGVEKSRRRGGAFVCLVQALLSWFWEHGADYVTTKTQITNYGSQQTLLNLDARIAGAHHCFHRWLGS